MSAATATQPLAQAAPVTHAAPKAPRVLSVDILRGLTIALMILVNDPGDGRVAYQQLDHAAWNGLTATDLVFPTFLFLVGCSIVFAMRSRIQRGESKRAMAFKIIRRSAMIFALDCILSSMPKFQYGHLRLYGVLTRIAIVYLVVALTFLYTQRMRVLLSLAGGCLLLYWICMRFVPTPGFGHPVWDFPINDPDKNLGAYLDRNIMGWIQAHFHTGHLYEKTRDPEGMLSTIPSFATALLGACTALWMRRPNMDLVKNRLYMLVAGVVSIGLGALWNPWFPVNKKVWTSSYVLVCAGIALVLLSLLSMLTDQPSWQDRPRWMHSAVWPWLVFGSNAIFAYAICDVWLMVFNFFHFANPNRPGRTMGFWGWGYQHFVGWFGGVSTANTSLVYSLVFVSLCFFSTWLLWRKKIFLKL